MQRIQRKMGRIVPHRSPNEADIDAMLSDFNDSDQMLEKIEAASKAWRDSWTNILTHQLATVEHFHTLYKPLGAEDNDYSTHVPVNTPPTTMQRCTELYTAFTELRTDMMEEVRDIETKLIQPARGARDSLKPMKKAIKKREDKKVDYERYKSRVDGLQIKQVRSDRDNTALAKHQADMARASTEYEYADESLRMQLPKLNAATFSILPLLLANQIVLQNNLIGNLYTVLSQYSREQGYPDPPLDPEEVASIWDANFTPLRKEIESEVRFLKEGKAIHLPMRQEGQGSTLTGLGLRNRVMPGRRTSGNSGLPSLRGTSPRPGHTLPSTAEDGPPPYLASKPSLQSLNASKPRYGAVSPGLSPSPGPDAWGPRRTSTASHASSAGLSAPNGHSDYFDAKPRIASAASSASSANPAAGKKKPPPPPPKKVGSFHSEFVTAMYDFDGQSAGDLVFREGDRIRVIKKTNNSQDWWEGELRGQKGSFPANYCK